MQAEQLLDALGSLLSVGLQDNPFGSVFAVLPRLFHYSHAFMLARDESGQTLPHVPLECIVAQPAALEGSQWPVGPLFERVLRGRVAALRTHEGIAEWASAQALGLSPLQSALYVPVRVPSRRGILVLLRGADEPGFHRGDVALAKRFAVLVSHALATRVAHQHAAESRRLRELTGQLRASEQAARRSAVLLKEIVAALPVALTVQDGHGRIALANEAAAELTGRAADALLGALAPSLDVIGAPAKRAAQLADFRTRLASGEAEALEMEIPAPGGGTRTLLVARKPVRIHDESLMLTSALDITARKQAERDLAHRAFHDQLTGLPNRALMRQTVEAALQRHAEGGGQFALAFIDLDNFKQVNDCYSHAVGDALLRAVAARVAAAIRETDTLARISGDEFVLLFDPISGPEALPPLVERVIAALQQPFAIEGHELMTSGSVGAAVFPLHGTDYETLRRNADAVMYRAKNDRKGSVRYFDGSMALALTARMEAEQHLRAALRDRRLAVALQPKVEIATGATVGFEALVRWLHPDGSVRLPGSFMGLAIELGLIDGITRFMVDEAARLLPLLWQRHGAGRPISINVAARQAGDVDFMHSLAAQIAAAGLGPYLVLELTEEALLATRRFQAEVLPQLRALGVRVSIDDFGTGFSSLATLADITADEVKIDRAFIAAIHERPRSQGILRAIESLCGALGMEVVAEGVETPEELDYLRRHTSIRLAQGYLFAAPRRIDEPSGRGPEEHGV
ncbi:MAG: putative signaling protein [Xylophilus sp.]|nr:MAG: putative signaling protein [Xylophilus sp.]